MVMVEKEIEGPCGPPYEIKDISEIIQECHIVAEHFKIVNEAIIDVHDSEILEGHNE